jgi:hypothetical protein
MWNTMSKKIWILIRSRFKYDDNLSRFKGQHNSGGRGQYDHLMSMRICTLIDYMTSKIDEKNASSCFGFCLLRKMKQLSFKFHCQKTIHEHRDPKKKVGNSLTRTCNFLEPHKHNVIGGEHPQHDSTKPIP